jgi:hypothetical protein
MKMRVNMKGLFVFVSVCAGFLLLSCDWMVTTITTITTSEPPAVDFDQERFDDELAAWNEQDPQNYEFRLRCILGPPDEEGTPDDEDLFWGCAEEYYFHVEDGKVTAEGKENGYLEHGHYSYYPDGLTVPQMYEEIAESVQWVREGVESGDIPRHSGVDVCYDSNHVPVFWQVSLVEVIGDPVRHKIKSFQINP